MARLPDRFDLWVRKARECADPARQVDFVLGALAALPEWHFLNAGSNESPQPGQTPDGKFLFVFSDAERIKELGSGVGVISIPFPAALTWCLERNAGLIVNQEVSIPLDQVQAYEKEWKAREPGRNGGFWIPNLTTEEEDFWQEHGL